MQLQVDYFVGESSYSFVTLKPVSDIIFALTESTYHYMLENYKVLTISHHTTSLKEIGNFVIRHSNEAELHERLHLLKKDFAIDEMIYLSTCNRLTFVFFTNIEIDKVTITLLPFFSDEMLIPMLEEDKGADVLISHFEMAGSTHLGKVSKKTSINKKLLSKWKKVYLGHYHNYHEITKDIGKLQQLKSIYIWDCNITKLPVQIGSLR